METRQYAQNGKQRICCNAITTIFRVFGLPHRNLTIFAEVRSFLCLYAQLLDLIVEKPGKNHRLERKERDTTPKYRGFIGIFFPRKFIFEQPSEIHRCSMCTIPKM